MTNEHSLALLEFARVKESVAGYCLSEEGREALLAQEPMSDAAAVASLKAAVFSLVALYQSGEELPSLAFAPVAKTIRLLAKDGTALEQEELYAIGLWSESFARFCAFMAKADSAEIRGILDPLPGLSAVSAAVFRVLNRDGSLRDLPELKSARERIARIHGDIRKVTESFFRDPETRSMLQSDEPTVRDGRTVLALRANFKGRLRGIVHEVSATGQTVFLEPEALVQKNNDLVQSEARYRQEIAKLLRETTERLRPSAADLARAQTGMVELDLVYARSRHARLGGLVMAGERQRGFVLRGARHPLLGPRAVPIDVELPEDVRTLIVTGPNTGGKTVTLKTIGLFALMNQFGLGLPAAPETALAVFDQVFADIGDEQSIDQSLSTFSGHMRVIGQIAASADERSLVLLDELGSGTDPEEGCAVAMSLIDWFIERSCLTVLTTHHGILKNFGYSKPGCINASMDFDANSLSPTYRIVMGIPGESRALEVAAKNGLPELIVKGARRYLSEERTDVSELIRGLADKHRGLEELETERRRRLRDAVEIQRKADLNSLKLRQEQLEFREHGLSDLKRLLSESRKTLENLVRELREGELGPEKTRAVKEFLGRLDAAVEQESARVDELRSSAMRHDAHSTRGAEPNGGSAAFAAPLAEGMRVRIAGGRGSGLLVRRDKKGRWLVETGALKLSIPESELACLPSEESSFGKSSVQVELAPRESGVARAAVFELDLRGFRLAEALAAVEAQIDAASLQGLSSFSIIHGTGEGVLSRGIHEHLRGQAAVADYHFARPEEGGHGKTVVRLA